MGYTSTVARRFSLLDREYFEALVTVNDHLAGEGMSACLVGGGAAQAWIANLRTGGGAQRLSDEPMLKNVLRKTRDLDFATRADPAAMLRALNGLAATTGGATVLGPRAVRLGPISVAFTLGPEDLAGMADYYDRFLESGGILRLRRGTRIEEVPTIGIEELLVTKLTRRGDKAKDILDLVQLFAAARDAGRALNLRAVRGLLADRPDALGLLDELEERQREDSH